MNPLQELGQMSNNLGINIQALTSQLAGATQQIQGLVSDSTTLGQQQLQAIGANAAAAAESQAIKADLRLKNQAIIGLDPKDLDNEYQKSINALNLAQADYDSNRQVYNKITSANIVDDPLGFIYGRLQLPTVSAKLNNSVAAITAATGNIEARQALLDKQNSVVVADTMAQDRKALGAEADYKMATAAMAQKQAQIGDIESIARMQTAQLSALNMEYDNKVKALQIQMQAAEAAGNRALRSRQIGEMDEMKALRIKELKGRLEDQEAYENKLLTIGQTLNYQVPLTPSVFKTLSKASQQAIDTLMLSGKFGSSLPESLSTIAAMPGSGVITDANPGIKRMLTDITKYQASVIGQLGKQQPGGAAPIPARDRPQVALEMLQEQVEQSTNNPKSPFISSSNIWNTNPNPTLVDPRLMQSVQLPNNSLSKAFNTVLSIKGPDAKLTKAEEQKAFRIIRDQVKAKQLDPDQAAADIVEYFSLGVAKSRDFYKYDKFGISEPSTYYADWESVGAFGKTIPVNLMSPGSVKRALISDVRGLEAFTGASQESGGTQMSVMGPISLFGVGAAALVNKMVPPKDKQ